MATDITKQNLAALASRYQKPAADASSAANNAEQGGIRNWRQRVVATRYTPGQYNKGAQTQADDKKNNNDNKNKKNKVEELGYDDFSLDDDENTNSNSSSSSEEEAEEDDVVVKDVPQPPITITKPAVKPEETNGKEAHAPVANKHERVPSLHMGFTTAKETKKEVVTSPASTEDRDKLVQQLRDEINKLKQENEEYKKMMTKFSGELQGAVSKLGDAIKELEHKEHQEQSTELMMKKMEQKLDEQLTRMEVKSMRMFQQYYETDLLRRAESGNSSKGVNTFLYVQFGLWVLIIVSLILWLSARRVDYE